MLFYPCRRPVSCSSLRARACRGTTEEVRRAKDSRAEERRAEVRRGEQRKGKEGEEKEWRKMGREKKGWGVNWGKENAGKKKRIEEKGRNEYPREMTLR